MELEIEAIRELFQEEINKKSVTMAVVREKLKGHPTLSNEDAKKICDRVRSEWRGIHSESHHLESSGAAELPTVQDTLSDKMSRFLSSSSEFVPPSNSSYLSKNIFSREEKKVCIGYLEQQLEVESYPNTPSKAFSKKTRLARNS